MIKVFYWNDIQAFLNTGKTDPFFQRGTGISIGCFDGLHLGHRALLENLIKQCKKEKLLSGVVSFKRPLPAIKHAYDYQGDISTLNQRIELFEKLGLDFVIIVDFDETFASILGADFLNILVNACNMELIAEGIDFRCGYKGATDVQAIRYFCEKNNIKSFFLDPVFYDDGINEESRICSSYIRNMIQKGFFSTVTQLLSRDYEIDFSMLEHDSIILRKNITQVLPKPGIYHGKDEKGNEVRFEITDEEIKILSDLTVQRISFN